MKKIFSTLLLFILITSCHHFEHYFNDTSATSEHYTVDLTSIAVKSGLKKIEYELIKEDLSGDPFKIKLYLYSNEKAKYDVEDLSKQCASAFLKKVDGVQQYKLIEVTLISNGEENESIFYHTSKLAAI